jgi:nucleoside-diphosphate-sugar epimerase
VTRGVVVVTGAAGFIGSHLVDRLLELGHVVVGIDRRTPDTDELAALNLARALSRPRFTLVTVDLFEDGLADAVAGAEVVYHLAAMPGVRPSWGLRFDAYVKANILGTRRLIDACERASVPRLVYASSSSVYGLAARVSKEADPARPVSPYGVTKLAGEQLCLAHANRVDTALSVVALRYFTVYGPRQRPDMAISRILTAALTRTRYTLFGDGTQKRDFTYVDDVVEATIAAARPTVPTTVINVAGGSPVSLANAISIASEVVGAPVPLDAVEAAAGDVPGTAANLWLASALLGYRPRTDLRTGMAAQAEWLRSLPTDLLQRLTAAASTVEEATTCSS